MGSYVKYTEEQKDAANSVRISEILDREGEKYKKWGKQFQWLRHDSVIFSGSKWFRYSEGEGGRAIGFCMKFFGKSFHEAMEYLLDFCPWVVGEKTPERLSEKNDESGKNSSGRLSEDLGESARKNADRVTENFSESARKNADKVSEDFDESEENPPTNFCLPSANPTMKNVYRYLIKERCVDPVVVSFFARNGSVYEEKAWHGVVFVGKDSEGKAKNAHIRGTQDCGTGKFRMTVEGSDSCYGFGHIGSGNILYAFEAPIDLLSFVSMYPKDWKQNSYVALNGVSDGAILRFLKEHPNVTSVVLCLDNDLAGEKACKRIAEDLSEVGITDVRRLTSHWKDWNEDLVALKLQGNHQSERYDVGFMEGDCLIDTDGDSRLGNTDGCECCGKGGAIWNQSLS